MKLLSVAIPCYNSAEYMGKCIESLAIGGEDVEVLVIDDGSAKDNTLEIAKQYEEKYPGIVRAIHQENKGHGGAVNTGIANATGLYFKVVDSDDWVKKDAYFAILDKLRELVAGETTLDLLVSNYVYEKVGEKHKKVVHYHHILPRDKMITWKDAGTFPLGHYILMHSAIYRTQLLRDCGLDLPEHTFYVDNLYVFEPLPYVRNFYYLDVNFYRYYIGRNDQSVNETVMIGRIDQQLKVNRIMIDYLVENQDIIKPNKMLWKYMRAYLEIITAVSSILLIRKGDQEALDRKKELWDYIKEKDVRLYRYLRARILGNGVNLPGKVGRKVAVDVYLVAQRIFGFN